MDKEFNFPQAITLCFLNKKVINRKIIASNNPTKQMKHSGLQQPLSLISQ